MFHNGYVRCKFLTFFSLVLILVFLLASPNVALAFHQRQVLGDSTSSSQISIPPTVEGPGLLLPDSPLFFLDNLKQNVRLLMSFTPEAKAKVHKDIAGERMAELRFMLARNNQQAVRTALLGVSDNLKRAAADVSAAKLTGRNISVLAKTINDDIRAKQEVLDILQRQGGRELKSQAKTIDEALKAAKVEVEDALPEDELENEIRDDLERAASLEVNSASQSAEKIRHDLEELDREAKKSAGKALSRREEAVKKALEERNEALKKVEERLLQVERQKQEKLLEVHGKAAEQAKEAVEKAKEAAQKFQKAQQTVNEIRSGGSTSGVSNSGKSDNSGSGNSGSGSSSSGSSGSGKSEKD